MLSTRFETNVMFLASYVGKRMWRFWREIWKKTACFDVIFWTKRDVCSEYFERKTWCFQDKILFLAWYFVKKLGVFMLIRWENWYFQCDICKKTWCSSERDVLKKIDVFHVTIWQDGILCWVRDFEANVMFLVIFWKKNLMFWKWCF